MDTVLILATALTACALWVSWIRLPVWLARSLHRHRLWQLRDEIVDEAIMGTLPLDHAAVEDLIAVTERLARSAGQGTLFGTVVWFRLLRRADPEVEKALKARVPQIDDLPLDVASRIEAHRENVVLAMSSCLLLGSWLGIATVLAQIPKVWHRHLRARATLDSATLAAARSDNLLARATRAQAAAATA